MFGARAGVDPRKMIQALSGGMAASRCLEQKSEKILSGDFEPGFKIDLHQKDLGLVQAAAAALGGSRSPRPPWFSSSSERCRPGRMVRTTTAASFSFSKVWPEPRFAIRPLQRNPVLDESTLGHFPTRISVYHGGGAMADRSGVAQDVSCRAFETREVSLPLFRRELLWHITGLHSLNRGYSAFRVSHRLGRLLTGYRQRSSYCHQRSDVSPFTSMAFSPYSIV